MWDAAVSSQDVHILMLNFFIPSIHRQGSPYSKAHFFDVYNKEHQLLTPAEMEELSHHDMDNSGLCMKELCTWCQEDVVEARKAGYLDSYQEKLMHDRILAFRAAMDGMYDCK